MLFCISYCILLTYESISDYMLHHIIFSYSICSIILHPYTFFISWYFILHCILLYHTILYCIIFYHIIAYNIIAYHIISYHTISYHTISSSFLLYYTILSHVLVNTLACCVFFIAVIHHGRSDVIVYYAVLFCAPRHQIVPYCIMSTMPWFSIVYNILSCCMISCWRCIPC